MLHPRLAQASICACAGLRTRMSALALACIPYAYTYRAQDSCAACFFIEGTDFALFDLSAFWWSAFRLAYTLDRAYLSVRCQWARFPLSLRWRTEGFVRSSFAAGYTSGPTTSRQGRIQVPRQGGVLRKCLLASTRGWVREGAHPPPARSAQAFGFAHL